MTYALFEGGKVPVADPTALEERVSDASLVLAVNSYKELCCMHLTGVALTSPNLILRCSELAAERSRRIVQFIKATLEEDESERKVGKLPKGFAETIKLQNIPSNFHDEDILSHEEPEECEESEMEEDSNEQVEFGEEVEILHAKTVVTGQWDEEEESSEESEDEEMQEISVTQSKSKKPKKLPLGDSSEEEETVVLK